MRRQLLGAAFVTAFLLAVISAHVAAARSVSCAVRLRAPAPGVATQSDVQRALRSLLNDAGATRARPLLAGGHVDATLDADALVAATPTGHPFASWFVLQFSTRAQRDRAVDVLRRHPALDVVESIRALEIPETNPAPHALLETLVPWNVERVRAPEAIARIEPDSSIIVAVIDSGADLSHPDLQNALWQNDDARGNATTADDETDQNGDGLIEDWERWDDDDNGFVDDLWGYDFTDAPGQGGVGDALVRDWNPDDENGHGTHVAGIIAADGQLRGVAPFVQLMVVRAAFNRFFAGAALETDDAAAAIIYAVDNGARVLNLSFGDTVDSRLLREAVDYALARDVVVVSAAGNTRSDAPQFPSAYPGVISVGASDGSDGRASFSNFGASVELAAPGEDSEFPGAGILSLGLDGKTRQRRGTSMSAPHVAGVAALVLSRADRPNARRTRALLVRSARRLSEADWSPDLGHGIVDALAAVTTDDDVVVHAMAPAAPYRDGRFTLIGTVLSGDAPRWSVAVRPSAGRWLTLVRDQARQVVADTLVSTPLEGARDGNWEFRIVAELGDGRLREARGAFFVDTTAPVLQRLEIEPVWRGAEPRWFVRTQTDDATQVSVLDGSSGRTLAADPGYGRLTLLETSQFPGTSSTWTIAVENVSGLSTSVGVPRPAMLPPWPAGARTNQLDVSIGFFPEPVVGVSPQGQTVVWGRNALSGFMQAWGVEGDALVLVHEIEIRGTPVAFADINGDGGADLLYRTGAQAPSDPNTHWLVTRSPLSFPDSIAASVQVSRALGLFDVDDDASFETLLSTGDDLFVYDDAVGRAPALIQTLANPSETSFNTYGSTAVVDDVDRDGRLELVSGDADGAISVFERGSSGEFEVQQVIASGGNYAYEYAALPEGGFLVAHRRTRDVAGDGFETVVYDFITYGANLDAQRVRSFAARLNALDAAVGAFRSSASGDDYVMLANENDLYFARGAVEPRDHIAQLRGDAGRLPAVADFDGDGHVEIVAPDRRGAVLYRFYEDVRGPHSLRGESLGADAVQLRWRVDGPVTCRVERFQLGEWDVLAETPGTSWIDSTVQTFVPGLYRVRAIVNGEPRGSTGNVLLIPQPRPRLLGAEVTSAASLRMRSSNTLSRETLLSKHVRVRDADSIDHEVISLALSEDGRALDVVVSGEFACGDVSVEVDSLRDDQWGLLDPPTSAVRALRSCPSPAFHVRGIEAQRGEQQGFRVEFSRAPAMAALDVQTYRITWRGQALQLQSVRQVDATRFDLVAARGTVFRGYGIPYEIRIATTLHAADGALQADAGTTHRVYVEGSGAPNVFASPNPAHPTDTEIVFSDASRDTRIDIYNLEGQLVARLDDSRGGGLRWNLRTLDGTRVQSGVYIFVARDSGGTSRGTVAILR